MKMKKFSIIFLLIILFSGCSTNKIPDKLIKKTVDKFARDFINNLNKGEIDSCYNKIEETYQNDSILIGLKNMYELLKDKAQINSRIISYKFSKTHSISNGNDFNTFSIEYEYQYSTDRWAYYSFILLEENNQYKIISFNFLPTYKSLDNIHDFTLKGKSFLHYLWLTLMILVPIFIILTVIFIIRTPVKYKWLWILLVIFGVVKFQLNWTTGEFDYQLINFTFFGAGFVKWGVIAPWIMSFSIPLVAIIFWFKRASVKRELEEESERKNAVPSEVNNEVKIVFQNNDSGFINDESTNNVSEIVIEANCTQEDIIKIITDRTNIPQDELKCYTIPKLFRIVKFLSKIKQGELIAFHDNNIRLIEKERWDGILASGNADKFKIIYKKE
jgi:hypothetical protein